MAHRARRGGAEKGELFAKVGQFFADPADAVNDDVVISGLGFQPKAVILFTSGVTTGLTDTVAAGTPDLSIGFFTSTSQRACISARSTDGALTSETSRAIRDDACINQLVAGGFEGRYDVQSIDSDGFTLNVDNVFDGDSSIFWLALGGSKIKNAKVGTIGIAASTGNQDFTDPGFTPDAALLISGGMPTSQLNTVTTTFVTSMGAIGGGDEAVIVQIGVDNSASSNTASYSRVGDECWAYNTVANGTLTRRASGSFITNGFRLNVLEAPPSTTWAAYLALQGVDVAIGTLNTLDDTTTDIVASGLGFAPKAVMFFSHCGPQSSADTTDVDLEISIGAAAFDGSNITQGVVCCQDRDALTTMQCSNGNDDDEVYLNTSSTDTLAASMQVNSFDADGFTCRMSDAESAGFTNFVWYIAFG
jgi:hypothetical protein